MAKLGDKSVGDVVQLKLNGIDTDFLIVQQGRPSTAYDASCDGTWLLMKDIYVLKAWESGVNNNDYENSDAHTYLNSTFLDLFDNSIKSLICSVKIPYTKGTGKNGTVVSGANGLSAKIFLLSYIEVVAASNATLVNTEGAKLAYFSDREAEKRIAYINGTARQWWTRSPAIANTSSVYEITATGSFTSVGSTNAYGFRPALILPSETSIDSVGLVNVGGAWKQCTDGFVNVNGLWKKISETYTNVGGVWKPIV